MPGRKLSMYARKRLDISWSDLASGMLNALFRRDEQAAARKVEEWFGPGAVAFLSVRSGLDLYLRLLALPRGSEVLVSALTIPDMWKILEQHGLVPVPVDLDPRTLAPLEERLRALCTPKTRAILVAHLYGTRIDLEPCARLARERGLLLLEDSAQAFTGREYTGDPRADVSMFSFGPIKTATALAGGVLVLRDAALRARLCAEQARYPLQSSSAYFARLWKYGLLKGLTLPVPYALFVRFCALRGRSVDDVIQGTVRGFKGGDFFAKIRHRPSAALLALIGRRLAAADGTRIAERTRAALRLRELLGTRCELPGGDAPFHSYWVFTLATGRPAALVERLREAGFDATQAATLRSVPAPPGRPGSEPRCAQESLSRTVYVPLYPEMPARAVERLARVLLEAAERDSEPRAASLELSHSS
jgi:dTDP-4-amino-4,6-dideoxygalactose transaminase